MKILITTEFYLPLRCGVTVAVLNLRKGLEKMGHEVRVLTIGKNRKSYYEDGVYYMGSNLPQFYKDSYATLNFGGRYFKDILAWNPDLIHSQCEFFTMHFATKIAKRLNCPIVHTCHTDFDSYRIHFTRSIRLWTFLTHRYIPRFLKHVEHIICPTEKVFNLLEGYGVKKDMTIVPTGLDLSVFSHELLDAAKNELCSKLGISESDFVLCSVCRLSQEKRVDETIKAFADLVKEKDNVKLLIVGSGDQEWNLKALVDELGLQADVMFTGSVPMEKVWMYYQISDLFISSSISETQGLTYFEALASSLPVVCRKDETLGDFLVEGYNGFYFCSSIDLIQIVSSLIDNKGLYESLCRNAYESVGAYSLEVFGNRVVDIYNQVLSRHRGIK